MTLNAFHSSLLGAGAGAGAGLPSNIGLWIACVRMHVQVSCPLINL